MSCSPGSKKRRFGSVSYAAMAVAACLALFIAVSFVAYDSVGEPSVTMDGLTLASKAVAVKKTESMPTLISTRAVPGVSVPLEAKLPREAELTVSVGNLTVRDTKTGKLIGEGKSVSAKGAVTIQWDVDSVEDVIISHEMLILDSLAGCRITLWFDIAEDLWKIDCIEI